MAMARASLDEAGRPGRRVSPRSPTPAPADQPVTGAPGALLCLACDQPITQLRHRIEVQGSHQHRFMNPGGFTFHIGCFAQAIGCRLVGPDSWEYPWFPSFAWRCAHCGGCGRQLGWGFRKPGAGPDDGAFFGLVLDRLRMQPDGD